jgi:hypothetical protein
VKESNVFSDEVSRIGGWMKNIECADVCLKKEKELMRVMSLDSAVGNEQEQSISQRPVISK